MIKLATNGERKISPSLESLNGDVNSSSNQMFTDIVRSFKEKFPMWDLSHMKCVMSSQPRNHDGDVKTNQADVIKYTGSWTKLDTIVINSDMKSAIEFYGIADRANQEILQKQAIGHELAHEIWKYQIDGDCRDRILQKAKDLTFDTPYLHHIDDDDPDEELFCEYMSYRVTGIWIKCK